MRKFKNFVIGGISSKIFNLVAGTVLLILTVYTVALGIQSKKLSELVKDANEAQIESMTGISDATMETIIDENLCKTTELDAEIADRYFSSAKSAVLMVADYTAKLYDSPDINHRIVVKTPDLCQKGTTCAQLIYDAGVDPTDYDIADEVGLLGNLADMLTSVYERSILDACYVSTETGVTLFADARPEIKVADDGSVIKYPARSRPWYSGAVEKKDVYFTDIIPDKYTGEYGVVVSCPVYDHKGELKAVVGADLFVDSMIQAVNESDKNGGFIFTVNEKGHVIMSPKTEGIFTVHAQDEDVDIRKAGYSDLAELIDEALTKPTGIKKVEIDDTMYYMCGAPSPTVGWAVISVVDNDTVSLPTSMLEKNYREIADESATIYNDNIEKTRISMLLILALVVIIAVANGHILSKKIVRPLNVMADSVSKIQGGELDFVKEKAYYTADEIEVLADAFLGLTNRTKSYINEITHITAEKERISAELNIATQIQADMLPRIFPPFPERSEFDLYASMKPAKEVGGDFYDFFMTDDNHLAMVMADVSGKGVPAALFMVIAKTLIKNRAMMGGTPLEILTHVNNELCKGNESELFVTVWLAILEISTGKGIASNAGHEHPILKHVDGEYEVIKYKHSPAVATMEDMIYREHEFELKKGDSLFVYTDGVPEATNLDNAMFGTEGMLNVLNVKDDGSCRDVCERVAAGVEEFCEGAEQFDDITMMCLKYYG